MESSNNRGTQKSQKCDSPSPIPKKKARLRAPTETLDNRLLTLTALGDHGLMQDILSFLPGSDWFNIRQVDRTFRSLYQEVGVYGRHDLDIHEAWQKMKEYLLFQGSPDALKVQQGPYPAVWREHFDIDLMWNDWDGSHITGDIEPIYNHETRMYNLEELLQLDIPQAVIRGGILACLQKSNQRNLALKESIQKIESDIAALTSKGIAPFNALFQIVGKYISQNELQPFRYAQYPHYQQGENLNSHITWELIKQKDGQEDPVTEYLEHLVPGRKLICKDHQGEDTGTVLKPCDKCHQKRIGVQTEFCGRRNCIHSTSVCPDCTTKATCSGCGEKFCKLENCFLVVRCSDPGCSKILCCNRGRGGRSDDEDHENEEPWDGTACSYVRAKRPAEHIIEYSFHMSAIPVDASIHDESNESRIVYCFEHKPDEAVPLPPLAELYRRSRDDFRD